MKKILLGFLLSFGCAAISQAAPTTDKIAYASSATITCSINSLGSSSSVGQSCASVDNRTNLYVDAYITFVSSTGAGAPANDKAIYIYAYGSGDGTNFDSDDANPGTDTSYTINAPSSLKGPIVVPVATTGKQYTKTFSVANMFGGVLPPKWGLVIVNFSGQSLAASGNSISYVGVTYTNQ